jgi:hypothetical protein
VGLAFRGATTNASELENHLRQLVGDSLHIELSESLDDPLFPSLEKVSSLATPPPKNSLSPTFEVDSVITKTTSTMSSVNQSVYGNANVDDASDVLSNAVNEVLNFSKTDYPASNTTLSNSLPSQSKFLDASSLNSMSTLTALPVTSPETRNSIKIEDDIDSRMSMDFDAIKEEISKSLERPRFDGHGQAEKENTTKDLLDSLAFDDDEFESEREPVPQPKKYTKQKKSMPKLPLPTPSPAKIDHMRDSMEMSPSKRKDVGVTNTLAKILGSVGNGNSPNGSPQELDTKKAPGGWIDSASSPLNNHSKPFNLSSHIRHSGSATSVPTPKMGTSVHVLSPRPGVSSRLSLGSKSSYNNEMQDLMIENELLRKKVESMSSQEDLDALLEENDSLHAQVASLKKQVEQSQAQVKELKDQIRLHNNMSMNMSDLKSEASRTEAKLKDLASRHQELQQELSQSKQDTVRLQSELSSKDQNLQEAKRELEMSKNRAPPPTGAPDEYSPWKPVSEYYEHEVHVLKDQLQKRTEALKQMQNGENPALDQMAEQEIECLETENQMLIRRLRDQAVQFDAYLNEKEKESVTSPSRSVNPAEGGTQNKVETSDASTSTEEDETASESGPATPKSLPDENDSPASTTPSLASFKRFIPSFGMKPVPSTPQQDDSSKASSPTTPNDSTALSALKEQHSLLKESFKAQQDFLNQHKQNLLQMQQERNRIHNDFQNHLLQCEFERVKLRGHVSYLYASTTMPEDTNLSDWMIEARKEYMEQLSHWSEEVQLWLTEAPEPQSQVDLGQLTHTCLIHIYEKYAKKTRWKETRASR